MNKPSFDQYYRYDEMTQLLRDFTQAFPQLATIESIGQSYERRDIWALTITQTATGLDREKPGFYVDGNIHGSEVTASVTALYFAWKLLSSYGEEVAITRLLDANAVYIIPAISPDGVEHVLSGTRLYPHEEEARRPASTGRGRGRGWANPLYAHRGSGRRLEGFNKRSAAPGAASL